MVSSATSLDRLAKRLEALHLESPKRSVMKRTRTSYLKKNTSRTRRSVKTSHRDRTVHERRKRVLETLKAAKASRAETRRLRKLQANANRGPGVTTRSRAKKAVE